MQSESEQKRVTPRGVLAFCREKEVRVIDLRFTDVFGKWHHVSIPVRQLTEATFESGYRIDACQLKLDGSLNRLVIPLPATAFLDSSATTATLVMICTIQDALTRDDDLLDPRTIAQRAVDFLASTGIAEAVRIGPQCEFYWFQSAQYARLASQTDFPVAESSVLSDQPTNRTEGYVADISFQARNEITESLEDMGFPIAMHHQMNSSGSKCRVDFVDNTLVRAADALMSLKHVARRIAENHHRSVTFMPKPIGHDCGASLVINLSFWRGEEPTFGGQGYGGLSEQALMAIGGILRHRHALSAICNPTTNSYRRLNAVQGSSFRSGYSSSVRQSACRVPSHSTDPRSKRVEVSFADPSANPYLAFAAIVMAAVDGIQNKMDAGKPLEKVVAPKVTDDSHDFPASLWDALGHLRRDHAFLLEGDVFSSAMLEQWITYKEQVERIAVERHATPSEFVQYFDC